MSVRYFCYIGRSQNAAAAGRSLSQAGCGRRMSLTAVRRVVVCRYVACDKEQKEERHGKQDALGEHL